MALLTLFQTISVKIALRIERGPDPPGRPRLSLRPHAHDIHPDFPLSLRFSRSSFSYRRLIMLSCSSWALTAANLWSGVWNQNEERVALTSFSQREKLVSATIILKWRSST